MVYTLYITIINAWNKLTWSVSVSSERNCTESSKRGIPVSQSRFLVTTSRNQPQNFQYQSLTQQILPIVVFYYCWLWCSSIFRTKHLQNMIPQTTWDKSHIIRSRITCSIQPFSSFWKWMLLQAESWRKLKDNHAPRLHTTLLELISFSVCPCKIFTALYSSRIGLCSSEVEVATLLKTTSTFFEFIPYYLAICCQEFRIQHSCEVNLFGLLELFAFFLCYFVTVVSLIHQCLVKFLSCLLDCMSPDVSRRLEISVAQMMFNYSPSIHSLISCGELIAQKDNQQLIASLLHIQVLMDSVLRCSSSS